MNKKIKIKIAAGALIGLLFSLAFMSQQSFVLSSANLGDINKPTSHPTRTATPLPTPTPYCPESYIELRVDKPVVAVNEIFTLTLIYHNLGLPYTGVSLEPTGLADFDPTIT